DVQRAIVVVAGVAAAVAVEIFLPGVGDGRTIVVRRTDAVTIGVAAAAPDACSVLARIGDRAGDAVVALRAVLGRRRRTVRERLVARPDVALIVEARA